MNNVETAKQQGLRLTVSLLDKPMGFFGCLQAVRNEGDTLRISVSQKAGEKDLCRARCQITGMFFVVKRAENFSAGDV